MRSFDYLLQNENRRFLLYTSRVRPQIFHPGRSPSITGPYKIDESRVSTMGICLVEIRCSPIRTPLALGRSLHCPAPTPRGRDGVPRAPSSVSVYMASVRPKKTTMTSFSIRPVRTGPLSLTMPPVVASRSVPTCLASPSLPRPDRLDRLGITTFHLIGHSLKG